MQELAECVKGLDWSPLWISLKTGIIATAVTAFAVIAILKVWKGRNDKYGIQ